MSEDAECEVLNAPGKGFLMPDSLAGTVLEGRALAEFLAAFRDGPKQQISVDSLRKPLEEQE
jgi:hypothetical protein